MPKIMRRHNRRKPSIQLPIQSIFLVSHFLPCFLLSSSTVQIKVTRALHLSVASILGQLDELVIIKTPLYLEKAM